MDIPNGQRKAKRLTLGISDPSVKASFAKVETRVFGVGFSTSEKPPTLLIYHSDSLEERDVRTVLGRRELSEGLNLRLIRSAKPEGSAMGRRVRHEQAVNGTATCKVKNGEGETLVLGTNHVLAICNKGLAGDRIMSGEKHIGDLYSFERLSFHPNATNTADAALYRPNAGLADVNDNQVVIAGVMAPREGQNVTKYGAKTGITNGKVVIPNNLVRVKYQVPLLRPDRTVFDWNPHEAVISAFAIEGKNGRFAEKGDSGALVADEAGNAVGMVVAVSDDSSNYTWAAEISPALACLGVSILTETASGD
jgi:hypothetical protein